MSNSEEAGVAAPLFIVIAAIAMLGLYHEFFATGQADRSHAASGAATFELEAVGPDAEARSH